MTRYIGLDVHMQSCTLAVVGPSGKRLQSNVVETNGRALLQVIRAVPTPRYLCFEEGTQSSWLYELLHPEVDDLVVTIPEKRRGVKNDSADAYALAEQLRIGAVKRRVFKNQGPFGALRAAVRGYEILTRDTVRAKNRLRALFRSRGLHELRDEVWSAPDRENWVKRLPSSHRELANTLGRQVDALEPLKASAEKLMLREAQKHAVTKRLATVPGIGPIPRGASGALERRARAWSAAERSESGFLARLAPSEPTLSEGPSRTKHPISWVWSSRPPCACSRCAARALRSFLSASLPSCGRASPRW